MTRSSLSYWLAANHLSLTHSCRVLRWLAYFPNIQAFFQATEAAWMAAGLSLEQITLVKQIDWRYIEQEYAWSHRADCHILSWEDVHYPSLLREISDPPLVLYVMGDPNALALAQIAMVGSRRATPGGIKSAERLADELVQAGLAVTSGLALGIDGASHRGALRARGVTIAVCGTGLHLTYPRSHQSLAKAIVAEQGALISEYPLSTPPMAWHFPRRNRIISGLSIGVVVVEAALKSGSLITVKHALDQNREVFAVPGSIHEPMAKGCHVLIRQGAKLVDSAQDILDEIQSIWQPKARTALAQTVPVASEMCLIGNIRSIFDQISHEIVPIERIILQTGLTAAEVSSILLKLELAGYIESVQGGYIRASLG